MGNSLCDNHDTRYDQDYGTEPPLINDESPDIGGLVHRPAGLLNEEIILWNFGSLEMGDVDGYFFFFLKQPVLFWIDSGTRCW